MGAYATPWGSPYGYAVDDRVNIFNDPQTALFKDVRKVNNVYRYLRDGWLGMYAPLFIRQFQGHYDFFAIGFDSEEEFTHRMNNFLEEVEPEYMGRLNSADLVKNPLVNRILQEDNYTLDSRRDKGYIVNNGITDGVAVDQRSILGLTAGTKQGIENGAKETGIDNQNQELFHQEQVGDTVMLTQDSTLHTGDETTQSAENSASENGTDSQNQSLTHNETVNDSIQLTQNVALGVNNNSNQTAENSATRNADDTQTQALHQAETMADTSTTTHNLERFADSPQDSDMTTSAMPIGWTGTAGAIGTDSKNDHYPKAEALIAMPWNEGYQTTATLNNNAHDAHNTTGEESKDKGLTQNRRAGIEAKESATLGAAINRNNQQGMTRGQATSGAENQQNTVAQTRVSVREANEAATRNSQITRDVKETVHRGETTDGAEHQKNVVSQTRTSDRDARENSEIDFGTSQNNNQGIARNQGRTYSDTMNANIMIGDTEGSRQVLGLEGRTVGEVWAMWQNQQSLKNVLKDLIADCRKFFLIVA